VRDDRERLKDILKATDQILSKTAMDERHLRRTKCCKVWVLHHLQIIGEAARSLSRELRQRHPDRVWAEAAGMRNILVHHYFEIDAEEVWKVVDRDLDTPRDRVVQILASELP
jgi:uncharacterized protein with HEPN domain